MLLVKKEESRGFDVFSWVFCVMFGREKMGREAGQREKNNQKKKKVVSSGLKGA